MPGSRPTSYYCLGIALAVWVASCASALAAPVVIADPGTRVVDTAHVLDAGSARSLENLLTKLEDVTGAQVKILTVPTTGDEDIFTFAQREYQLWKLGSKEKGDGALIVLAPQDRKVRIHTGYGLEGALPDSWIGSLSREIAAEYFKKGDYAQGLRNMTVAVVNKVADDQGKTIDGAPNIRHAGRPNNSSLSNLILILFILLVIYMMYRGSQNQKQGGSGLSGPGWFGGFGGFGGGFSGGSFGGGSFGGGSFGGSFGGGGSSGGGGGGASW